MEILSLNKLKVSQVGIIKNYSSNIETNLKRRLLELGFCDEVKVKVVNKSFLGEVVLIEINGYVLAIRKNILKNIMVKVEDWKK